MALNGAECLLRFSPNISQNKHITHKQAVIQQHIYNEYRKVHSRWSAINQTRFGTSIRQVHQA
jgi:hypothetical protein